MPYLSWFAERAHREGNIRYTFLNMYPERPAMIDEMRDYGFDCEWIPYDQGQRRSGMIKALPALWGYMRKYKPDIVHCNLFDDTVPGLIAAKLASVRTRVTTRQDTGFHWNYAPRWVAWDRMNMARSTHVIAISSECRRFLIEKEGVPPEKITLVHNGIPPERFTRRDPGIMHELRTRFGLHGRGPIIGTVARFIEWKGYRHIVETAEKIIHTYPEAVFLFCGEGPQQAEVRRWVLQKDLDRNVIFTGWIERDRMASFYGILDLYLHAAELEPFGLVYPEAMMNAVPVVSTPTGAALDAIEDGRNGFLSPQGPSALAAAVQRALSSDLAAIGSSGMRIALEKFNFEVMWKGTIGVYHKALAAK